MTLLETVCRREQIDEHFQAMIPFGCGMAGPDTLEEDTGQIMTEVKIQIQLSDKTSTCLANALTISEEYMH